MSEENGVVVEQASATSTETTSEATAAAAAFATARGDAPPEPVAQPEKVEAPRDDQGRFAKTAEEAPPQKLIAGKTEEEVVALLAEIPAMKEGYRKQIDNLAGNYGKLNAAFQRLQQDTPQGVSVEATDEDFADMIKEFGPELAGMSKSAINNVLKKLNVKGTSQADPEAVQALVSEGVSKALEARTAAEAEKNARSLSRMVPDWQKVIGVPDAQGQVPKTAYREWLATQPADYQQDIAASNNAYEIAESVKAFQASEVEAAKKREQNKQRLANAVRPEGSVAARSAISEQQAADQAFQARRQRA